MKKLIYLCFLLVPFLSIAQNKVEANQIIDQINKGENVNYQNTEITGDLDFTKLQNSKIEKSHDDDDSHTTAVSTVKSSIRFINCRFTGDVLAYISAKEDSWRNKRDTTYNANFDEDVMFENCSFERASAFKHSKFGKNVSFRKSIFKDDAIFKYSKFSKGPDFSGVNFEEGADFKYTDFPRGVNFSGASFKESAVFKYAKFTEGVNFKNTTFNSFADFKYTNFSQPLEISGVSFSGNEDFKYAKVDGKNFTSYILNNK